MGFGFGKAKGRGPIPHAERIWAPAARRRPPALGAKCAVVPRLRVALVRFLMSKPACLMCEMTEVRELPERWECVTSGHEWERAAEPEAPATVRVVKGAHGYVLAEVIVSSGARI